jgi:Ser/Thr protein kinase RdoA (MazF antagonist)
LAHDPHEARVRTLLRAHPSGLSLSEAPLIPIGAGAINRCWRAQTDDGLRFVRLASPEARDLGADWDTELALLQIASQHGLAPAPLLAAPSAGLLVTEFIAAAPLAPGTAATPDLLLRVGAVLRAVHALPAGAGIRRLDFATQARQLETRLRRNTTDIAWLRSHASRVFAGLQADRGDAVPCHNDLHRENVLDDGRRLWLVDWEYGGLGDARFDLASYASHHSLSDDNVGSLLAGYGTRVDPARLRSARWAYDYVQWLWHRLAAQVAGPQGAASLSAADALARTLAEGR